MEKRINKVFKVVNREWRRRRRFHRGMQDSGLYGGKQGNTSILQGYEGDTCRGYAIQGLEGRVLRARESCFGLNCQGLPLLDC